MSPAAIGRRTFAALANPNYRRWYAGQGISLVGTWMQTIAQGWLVYTLTGSGTQLGLVVALQMVPVLILAPYAGVMADRVDKRRLIIAVQGVMAVLALILGLLTVTGAVRLWEVYVLAAALGIATAFDNPARQAFVMELVGPDHVRNAVTLNSVLVNAARAVGPAVAGILIATVGVSVCFLVNAGSYVAVIASLLLLDRSALRPSIPAPRSRGQLREGLRYVASTPALAVPLVMMGVIGALAYEFQVVLPIVARETFGGGAEVYGFLTAAMGAGAVVGGLIVAGSGRTGTRAVITACFGFGVSMLLAAAAPTPAARARRDDDRRRRQRDRPRGRQQHAAAGRPARHARARDEPLGRRVPRHDADRRADRRMGLGDRRRPCGPAHGRHHVHRGRRRSDELPLAAPARRARPPERPADLRPSASQTRAVPSSPPRHRRRREHMPTVKLRE